MDRHLLAGAVFLLFLEIFILLGDMDIVPFKLYDFDQQKNESAPIGEMILAKNEVRRKFQSSFIWSNTSEEEQLFEHDSILTLSNSSAKLKLQGNISITLDEDTLVVLSPPNKDNTSNLLFMKGDMRSESSAQKLTVGTKKWTLSAKENTDLHIKKTGKDQLELEVHSGEVQVENISGSKTQTIKQNTRVELKDENIESILYITNDIKWMKGDLDRIYTHTLPVQYNLQWEGDAQTINASSSANGKQSFNVNSTQNRPLEFLDYGTYSFSLEAKGKTSKTFKLQIIPAPKISYFSPLPRDRVKTQTPKSFAWSALNNANSYEVQFSKSPDFEQVYKQFVFKNHYGSLQLTEESKYFWRVQARDEEGFIIPEDYNYEIYYLKNPLSAPVPIEIRQRLPSSEKLDQSSLLKMFFHWLIPTAHAADLRAIEFNWSQVKGAKKYTLEISDTANFRDPQIINVEQNQYTWTQYKLKKYYWRVAGEDSSGQLGLFSQVQSFSLKDITKIKGDYIAPGVSFQGKRELPIKKSPSAQIAEKKPAPPDPEVKKDQPKEEPPPPLEKQYTNTSFEVSYGLGYTLLDHVQKNDFNAKANGLELMSIYGQMSIPLHRSGKLVLAPYFQHSKYEAEDLSTSPFQQQLDALKMGLSILYNPVGWKILLGAHVESIPVLKRETLESLKIKNIFQYGIAARYSIDVGKKFQTINKFIILNNEDYLSLRATSALQYDFHWIIKKLHLGFELKADYILDSNIDGTTINPTLYFGKSF